MAEIISLEDFYTIMCSSKPTLYKAIASLILSSGMTPTNLSKLRLNDFLDACEDYFHENEDKTLKNLLSKNPWEIIPLWKLKSEHRLTFSSPESTFYIFMYLNEKRKEDLDNLKDPLFKRGEKNFLTSSKISSYVTEFNKLNLNNTYFNSKNLIYTFEKVCNQHLILEQEHKENLIELFTQGNLHYYKEYKNNIKKLRKYYQMLSPFLISRIFDFERQVTAYKNSLKHQRENYNIIRDSYNVLIEKELNLNNGEKLLLCKFANDISKEELFITNKQYLIKLFKKAKIRLNIHNYHFHGRKYVLNYIEREYPLDKKINFLFNEINNLNYYNSKTGNPIINIDEKTIKNKIAEHLINNNFYDTQISDFEAVKLIEEIMFELID